MRFGNRRKTNVQARFSSKAGYGNPLVKDGVRGYALDLGRGRTECCCEGGAATVHSHRDVYGAGSRSSPAPRTQADCRREIQGWRPASTLTPKPCRRVCPHRWNRVSEAGIGQVLRGCDVFGDEQGRRSSRDRGIVGICHQSTSPIVPCFNYDRKVHGICAIPSWER